MQTFLKILSLKCCTLLMVLLGTYQLQLFAQTTQVVRVRGIVESFNNSTITINERSGRKLTIDVSEKLGVNEIYKIDLAAITPNSYIGTATLPDKDGNMSALEVLVFPEASRGNGEGSYPWDLEPNSTMTNATVAEFSSMGAARKMHLKYKDGEKIVYIPENTPIVTFTPGNLAMIKPGAKVIAFTNVVDGKATVMRISVGRDGLMPPM